MRAATTLAQSDLAEGLAQPSARFVAYAAWSRFGHERDETASFSTSPAGRQFAETPAITGLRGTGRYWTGLTSLFSRPSHSSALPSFRRPA